VIDVAGAQASLAHVLASLHLVNSQWSLAAAAAIRARSPVAQAVIHRLLEGLDEAAPEAVLAAERGVMERFLAHPDFATGLARARGSEVGAEWNPGRIEQVKPADVEAILGPAAKGPAAAGASS